MIIISPHLIFPYLTLFYLILPYSTLLYIILHYVTLFYLTLPYLTLTYFFLSFYFSGFFPFLVSHSFSSSLLTLPDFAFPRLFFCLSHFSLSAVEIRAKNPAFKNKTSGKEKDNKVADLWTSSLGGKNKQIKLFCCQFISILFQSSQFFAFLMLLPLLLLLYSFHFIVTSTFPSLFLSIFTSTYFSYFSFYTLFSFMIIIGLLKPKPKRPKMDSDGVAIPTPAAPHRDPTPLEVLSRFTIAQDEELPGLVWDLIDEVRGVMRLSRH